MLKKTYLFFRIISTNFSNQTTAQTTAKKNTINIIKLTVSVDNVSNFPDTQCPKSNKMRVAERNTANKTTSEIYVL